MPSIRVSASSPAPHLPLGVSLCAACSAMFFKTRPPSNGESFSCRAIMLPPQRGASRHYHRKSPLNLRRNAIKISMKPLHKIVALLAPVALACWSAAQDNAPPPGFTALFDGRTFDGWKVPAGDNGHWRIAGGVIDCDAASEAKGEKSLFTEREFANFELHVDWRLKEAPFINNEMEYILPDGSVAHDCHGKPLGLGLPDADSGIYLRGSSKSQINIWCWPAGSGEIYGYRKDAKMPEGIRAGATPRTQADRPVGEWNRFVITVRGDRVTVVLNDVTVIDNARLPGIPAKGPLALQHHGSKENGHWTSAPSLVQFKNIYVRQLSAD
jgi:hypothetical protein